MSVAVVCDGDRRATQVLGVRWRRDARQTTSASPLAIRLTVEGLRTVEKVKFVADCRAETEPVAPEMPL